MAATGPFCQVIEAQCSVDNGAAVPLLLESDGGYG